jgi:UDP-N-acetylmuramoyl-L-alanyl-D-glutamate--2,6-diaminopimelate ligase
MKLADLLQPWITSTIPDCDILGIKNDSRQIERGDLFIAYSGALSDGRKYIAQAVQQGASAVVYEPQYFPADLTLPTHIPCYPIPHLVEQLAAVASQFFHHPSEHLSVSGVTGTNGKTTIAYQLAQAHQLLGRPAAYIGTLGYGQVPNLHPLHNTTPDALEVQRLLSKHLDAGTQQICMEVSSHALVQHRVDHVRFREAIYTNLSHEHLDYHPNMQAYAAAKSLLFAKPGLEWVVLNQDDDHMQQMAAAVSKEVRQWTYGIRNPADVRALDCQLLSHCSRFLIESPWGRHSLTLPNLGLFNISNSLAVYTSLMAHGYPVESVIEILPTLQTTPGRMEIVAHNPYVIVDFAHTPAALDNVLKTIVSLKSSPNVKIWVVFGCGGNRDKTKRPLMAKVVSEQADHVIVTSDNPRHEDPEAIIQDISVGLKPGAAVTTLVDRREAIQHALRSAGKEDIVLIAGKGHENYQIIGDQCFDFSDQDEVRQFLRQG